MSSMNPEFREPECPPGYEPVPEGWGELPAIDDEEHQRRHARKNQKSAARRTRKKVTAHLPEQP